MNPNRGGRLKVCIITVPYDSGLPGVRMGGGPDHLLRHGLAAALEGLGHAVVVMPVHPAPARPLAEIRTAFELNRLLAGRVRQTIADGGFPLVLAGNCNTALGTLGGLGTSRTGVVWFDAHGDLNTPETTTSGFLDGMALAAVTGRCWSALATAIPGFRPVPDQSVLLIGARNLDPPEAALLANSSIGVLSPEAVRARADSAIEDAITALSARVDRAYVHLDLDVIDADEARANEFASPGGLSTTQVEELIRSVTGRCRIAAAALTAYDPSVETGDRARRAAARLIDAVVRAATAA